MNNVIEGSYNDFFTKGTIKLTISEQEKGGAKIDVLSRANADNIWALFVKPNAKIISLLKGGLDL